MADITMKFSKKTGEIKIEANGFKGPSCAEATRFLKDALGNCTDFTEKSEWYETNLELGADLNSNLCG